jgi:hypothetical protein
MERKGHRERETEERESGKRERRESGRREREIQNSYLAKKKKIMESKRSKFINNS